MRFRLSSLRTVALVTASLFLTPQKMVADVQNGIVIYDAQHGSLVKSRVDGLTKETGTKVTLCNDDNSRLGNQLVQEGFASPVDVFLTKNSPSMVLVDNIKLFAPLDATTLQQVPAQYHPQRGCWIGTAACSIVFVYNPAKTSKAQLPYSLMSLTKSERRGCWVVSPSGANFQAIVSAALTLKGKQATFDWLKVMKTNFAAYKDNSMVMEAVNTERIDGGVTYHCYRFADQSKAGENSKNTQPYYFKHQNPGAPVSISGGGVLASSKYKAQAQAFTKQITDRQGQDALRTGNAFRYAVGVDAASSPKLTPPKDLDASKVKPSSPNSEKVTELTAQVGLP